MKLIAATGMAATLFIGAAQAAQYSFYNVSNNSGVSDGLGDQFTVDVDDAGSNQVSFTFKNNVGEASVISEIYFDDETGLLGAVSGSLLVGNDAVFSMDANPDHLPADSSYNFTVTPSYALLSADSPAPQKGLNDEFDFVTITFNIVGGTYADILAAIGDGSSDPSGLRMGLHVTGIGPQSESDAFINNPCATGDEDCDGGSTFTPVPVPASLPLLVGALGLAGFVARRKKRA